MKGLARILLPCLVALAPVALLPHANAARSNSDHIVVELNRRQMEAGPGEKISLESRISNGADASLEGYVAHLEILTTDESVYVDPEDWSPERTQYLDSLAAGDSVDLTWSVQAVTSGPIIIYVSVTSPSSGAVSSSNPLNLNVGGQRKVDSSQVMPLVLYTPAAVLLLLGMTYARRRRHR